MTFHPEKISDFIQIFKSGRETIRAFEGCHHVELLNDISNPNVFCTCSKWESEEYLSKYRESDFFKITWGKTKILFSEKPEAWSLKTVEG